jgi:hypothetical protein
MLCKSQSNGDQFSDGDLAILLLAPIESHEANARSLSQFNRGFENQSRYTLNFLVPMIDCCGYVYPNLGLIHRITVLAR